jgi:hypothetical protein
MPIAHKIGAKVRQVVKPIQGEVANAAIIDGEVQFEVSYTGDDGEQHSRFFKEDEIEAAGEAEQA